MSGTKGFSLVALKAPFLLKFWRNFGFKYHYFTDYEKMMHYQNTMASVLHNSPPVSALDGEHIKRTRCIGSENEIKEETLERGISRSCSVLFTFTEGSCITLAKRFFWLEYPTCFWFSFRERSSIFPTIPVDFCCICCSLNWSFRSARALNSVEQLGPYTPPQILSWLQTQHGGKHELFLTAASHIGAHSPSTADSNIRSMRLFEQNCCNQSALWSTRRKLILILWITIYEGMYRVCPLQHDSLCCCVGAVTWMSQILALFLPVAVATNIKPAGEAEVERNPVTHSPTSLLL